MSKADPAMRVTGRRLPPGMQKPEPQSGGQAARVAQITSAPPNGTAQTAAGRAASKPEKAEYSDRQRTRAHFSLYTPLYDRARFIVYDLDRDMGYRTDVTEIVNALLHFGPKEASEVRELVERFRAELAPDIAA